MSQRKEHQLAIRVTSDELEAIGETAKRQRRTISDTVRLLLADAIAAQRQQQQHAA